MGLAGVVTSFRRKGLLAGGHRFDSGSVLTRSSCNSAGFQSHTYRSEARPHGLNLNPADRLTPNYATPSDSASNDGRARCLDAPEEIAPVAATYRRTSVEALAVVVAIARRSAAG